MIYAILALSLIINYLTVREHRQERQKLLDRIQARDLTEYKALETSVEPKKKEINIPRDELKQL